MNKWFVQFKLPVFISLVLIMALAITTFVLADTPVADGDGDTPVADNNKALGNVCLGSSQTFDALVAIKRNGGAVSNGVYKDGSKVTISIYSMAGVSAEIVAEDSITLPNNWGSLVNNTMSADVLSKVTFVANNLGSFSGSVTYRGTGTSSKDSSTLIRDDVMQVTAYIVDCTPPVIAAHGDVTVDATSDSGAIVNYTLPTATDNVDSAVEATCSPASGTSFNVGDTTVTCNASDKAGNAAAPTTFTVTVNPFTPPNTPPQVSVLGVTNGTAYAKGSVPAVSCEVTDAEDSDPSTSPSFSDITGPYTSDGIGQQTASCSYTDHGGLTATASVTYSIIDPSAPLISYTLNPASPDGSNGWYKSDVTLTWTVSEPESPNSLAKNDCVNQTITADQAETSYSCLATSAGGSTGPVTVSIKRDATAPVITASLDKTADATTGWYNIAIGAPTVSFACSDILSGVVDPCPSPSTFGEGANQSRSETIYDKAGNSASDGVSKINVDLTAPVITDLGPTTGPDGSNGWYKSAVTNTFKASDNLSGFSASQPNPFTVSTGAAEGSAVKVNSGTVTDVAGNTSTAIDSAEFKIDLSNPTNIAFVGGPADSASYYFSFVPAAPTCTAEDAVSGLASCVVTGYSAAVGNHTMTATATDNAGRTATATKSYTVMAWTISGFYQPIDMPGSNFTTNTLRGGSTVPVKFELFAGSTELTDPSKVKFNVSSMSCTSFAAEAQVEITTSGSTSLRYDTVAGQFIYNWQTPKGSGGCYKLTMTSEDGSSKYAFFKLK